MDLNIYKTDRKKEVDGVWQKIGDADIKVARANNPKYKTALNKYLRKYVPPGAKTEDSEVFIEKATIEAMAESILVDWKNIAIDGEILEPSKENAVRILTEFPDFREIVSSFAIDRNCYTPDEIAKK